ncbi:hypothetical protein ACW2QC_16715 [Virgibacillus sp. FSP13]
MSNENKASRPIIDMLVDSTLKKHGATLEPSKIDPKEKEQIKKMVDNLRKSVEDLSREEKEEKE